MIIFGSNFFEVENYSVMKIGWRDKYVCFRSKWLRVKIDYCILWFGMSYLDEYNCVIVNNNEVLFWICRIWYVYGRIYMEWFYIIFIYRIFYSLFFKEDIVVVI